MKRYDVKFKITFSDTVQVHAENPQDTKKKLLEMFRKQPDVLGDLVIAALGCSDDELDPYVKDEIFKIVIDEVNL